MRMGQQLNLFQRISRTTDPWEFFAKRYIYSENTLFYRCHFEIGDEPTFKIVPPIESREELVRRAHNLGHFSFEKTFGLLKEKYYGR